MTDHNHSQQRTAERYLVRSLIASGGMATVHLAEDVVLDREVALKILHRNFATDSTFVDRFRREAQAAGRLRHPNIVTIYDWGPYEDSYFIAMEYVPGPTLSEVLAAEGPLAPERAARIAGQIVEALDVAHRQGLVHRDIKPSNILVATATEQVKVADFGIARAVEGDLDLTQAGMIVGTAAYLSPEQARGSGVDPRSDLYSLGVLLFEMVTGQRPFTGDHPFAVATQHVSTPAPRLRSVRASLPDRLDELVDRLLAKDPADRYQSTTELALDLRRIEAAARESVDRPPPAAVEDLDRTAIMDGAHAAGTAAAAGNGAVAATEVMPSPARPDQDPGPVPDRDDRPRPSSGLPIVLGALGVVGLVALLLVVVPGLGARSAVELTDTTTSGAPASEPAPPMTVASEGPVEIPELVGRTRAEAEQAISALGLTLQVESSDVEPGDRSDGRVISQDPAPGEQVETGGSVLVVIAKAVETTEATAAPSSTAPSTTTAETSTTQTTASPGTTAPAPSPTPPPSG
jgi:serine/threonine-protein kinase